jgi:hypothetical protein
MSRTDSLFFLILGQQSSSQLPMAGRQGPHLRLRKSQVLTKKMMICHQLRRTWTDIVHLMCFLIQKVVPILKPIGIGLLQACNPLCSSVLMYFLIQKVVPVLKPVGIGWCDYADRPLCIADVFVLKLGHDIKTVQSCKIFSEVARAWLIYRLYSRLCTNGACDKN